MSEKKSSNVVWHENYLNLSDRRELLGKKNKILWFTGLSGSGKSTLAIEVQKKLHEKGFLTYILDGDNIRHGLNGDLGFSAEDRKENIRRIGEVTKLLYDAGIYVLVCFISPYRADRQRVRELVGEDFVEIYVKCSLEKCEERDTKGLYKKARAGKIKDFTGISAPYQNPENAEISINTNNHGILESVKKILEYIKLDF